jgi:hypothetical protein
MADILSALAADFLQGWACILVQPDANGQTTVTVDGISARGEPGLRVWLQRKPADKVVAAFLSRCQQAQRRPRGGLAPAALPRDSRCHCMPGIFFAQSD